MARNRSPLDALITERSLSFINTVSGTSVIDLVESGQIQTKGELTHIKNVCAKVPVFISEEIDQVCALLGLSKRLFIEKALMEALDQARAIMEKEGVFDIQEELAAIAEHKGEQE